MLHLSVNTVVFCRYCLLMGRLRRRQKFDVYSNISPTFGFSRAHTVAAADCQVNKNLLAELCVLFGKCVSSKYLRFRKVFLAEKVKRKTAGWFRSQLLVLRRNPTHSCRRWNYKNISSFLVFYFYYILRWRILVFKMKKKNCNAEKLFEAQIRMEQINA